jgi:hypothetical protein
MEDGMEVVGKGVLTGSGLKAPMEATITTEPPLEEKES